MKSSAVFVFLVSIGVVATLFAAPATAQIDEGFTCSAPAFATIGGLDMIGEGRMSMFVDKDYRPVSTTFRYQVRDRITGMGKLEASWAAAGGAPDFAVVPSNLRIPVRARVPDSFTITVSFDTAPVATHRFERTGGIVKDLDATGFAARGEPIPAIVSAGEHSWLPAWQGRRLLSYDLRAAGASAISDTFLLPDFKAFRRQIARATRSMNELRRKRSCDRTFVLKRD
jgi:hypothetical protein